MRPISGLHSRIASQAHSFTGGASWASPATKYNDGNVVRILLSFCWLAGEVGEEVERRLGRGRVDKLMSQEVVEFPEMSRSSCTKSNAGLVDDGETRQLFF